MTLNTYEDLLSFLRGQGAVFVEVPGQPAVELATHQPPVEGVLCIIWHPDVPLVQLVHPLPFQIPPDRIPAIERALLLINHALILPGFGMNHAQSTAYFRLALPRQVDAGIAEAEFQRAISTLMGTLRNFWEPLRAVAEGAPPEGVLSTGSRTH